MQDADRQAIFDMIDKMKAATTAEQREAASVDLKTMVLMAADPELDWAEHPPVILTQGARTYRAYPLTSSEEAR